MRGGGTGGEERRAGKGKNGVCVWVGRGGEKQQGRGGRGRESKEEEERKMIPVPFK